MSESNLPRTERIRCRMSPDGGNFPLLHASQHTISDALVLGRVRRRRVAGVGIGICVFGQFNCSEALGTVLLLPYVKVCYEMLKVLCLINVQFQYIYIRK